MIQRIQSLFLLCTTIVTGLMFFMPVASVIAPDHHIYEFYTTKVIQTGNIPEFITWNWMSLVLNAVITALAFLTIFIHKKKSKTVKPTLLLQLRLCFANVVLQLGLIVLMWLQVRQISQKTGADWSAELSFIFPLIGVIFTWLAIRGIIKDIALLKSFDRIR
ncbi:MAG: DUF4293 domain-containing protein [Odoribacter sp.]